MGFRAARVSPGDEMKYLHVLSFFADLSAQYNDLTKLSRNNIMYPVQLKDFAAGFRPRGRNIR
jgi:hypothetical protein